MPANQSTPEVTRADTDSAFLYDLAGRLYRIATPAMGFDQNDTDQLYRIARDLAKPATPARGGDKLREAAHIAAFRAIHGEAGDPLESPETFDFASKVADAILVSTDMAGASVPDRLARRMGAEFVARDDVPPVEGLTSGEGDAPEAITYNPVYGVTYIGADPTRGHVYSLAASPKATAPASVREHLQRMIDAAANYIEPTTYIARHPDVSSIGDCQWVREFPEPSEHQSEAGKAMTQRRRDQAFIRDMLYMLDGPEQREAMRLTDSGTAATIGGERA